MRNCYLCGARFALGESYFSNGRRAFCLDCADMVSVEDLQLLTDAEGTREMLTELGFYYDYN